MAASPLLMPIIWLEPNCGCRTSTPVTRNSCWLHVTLGTLKSWVGLCRSGATGLATVTAALETQPDRTTGPDEPRTLAQRRADRLVGICGETLDTSDPIDTHHEPDTGHGHGAGPGDDPSADESVVEREPVRLSAESAEMLMRLLSGEPVAPTEATTAEICAALGLPTLQDIAMEAPSRSTIDVIIDLETLLGRDHPNIDGLVQTLADGRPIPTEVWELLACDTSIRRVVTKGKSQVINYGRATPIISDLLRKLVRKRDRHCQFSGCDIPARYCDIHHLVHWHLGGNTDEQNLACVCRRHHNMIHKLGWTLTRNANGQLITTSP